MIRQSDYQQLSKTLRNLTECEIVKLIFVWAQHGEDDGRESEAFGVICHCRYELTRRGTDGR